MLAGFDAELDSCIFGDGRAVFLLNRESQFFWRRGVDGHFIVLAHAYGAARAADHSTSVLLLSWRHLLQREATAQIE